MDGQTDGRHQIYISPTSEVDNNVLVYNIFTAIADMVIVSPTFACPQFTLVNVCVDLVVFMRIAGTS